MKWPTDHATVTSAFHHDGYVFIESLLSDSILDDVQSNVDRFIRDVLPGLPREHVFYENKDAPSSLKQIQQLGKHDEYFSRLMNEGPFREVAELLLGVPADPKNLQYFNKPAGIGQPTPPHQDGYYFMLEPCEALTMWFALDHVDAENGCVRYVPGSHLCGMRPHGRTQTLGFSQGITDYSDDDMSAENAFPARPGDLLVHQAMTIHRADGNRSTTRSRRALGFVYYSQRAQPDEAAHLAYQQKLKQEMVDAGQI